MPGRASCKGPTGATCANPSAEATVPTLPGLSGPQPCGEHGAMCPWDEWTLRQERSATIPAKPERLRSVLPEGRMHRLCSTVTSI